MLSGSLSGLRSRKVKSFLILIAVIILTFLYSCEDELVKRDYPKVRTLEITNITENGAAFVGEVYEEGNVEITEHGFVWSMFTPLVGRDNIKYLGSFGGTGIFKTDVGSALSEGINYKVAAFVKAGDYLVYGNIVEFTSLGSKGPEIEGFSPESVYCNDTILVRGQNFSYLETDAYFDNIHGQTLYPTTDSLLKIVVPYSLTTSENVISVKVADNLTSFNTKKLIVNLPYLDTVMSESAFWGDSVYFRLGNTKYLTEKGIVDVFLDMVSIPELSNNNPGEYGFMLPATVESGLVEMRVVLSGREIKTRIKLNLPQIDSLSALTGMSGDVITIYGSLSSFDRVTAVNFGEIPGIIRYKSLDSIVVEVPDVTGGFFPVYLMVEDKKIKVTESFEILAHLDIMPTLPFTSYYAFTMKFGEEIIVVNSLLNNNTEKQLYKFDQATGSFSRLNDITYTVPYAWPAVVTKGNIAYFLAYCDNQSQVFMFDRETLEFNKLCDFPGGDYMSQILLDGDSVLYMGGGFKPGDYSSEFWKYNYATGDWSRLKAMPGKSCYSNEFTLNGNCYVVMQDNKMYQYQPSSDTWIQKASYPGYWCRFKVSVAGNNKAYMGYGDSQDNILRQYDPIFNVWNDVTEMPQSLNLCCINFSLGNRIYIGGGNNSNLIWRY